MKQVGVGYSLEYARTCAAFIDSLTDGDSRQCRAAQMRRPEIPSLRHSQSPEEYVSNYLTDIDYMLQRRLLGSGTSSACMHAIRRQLWLFPRYYQFMRPTEDSV